MLYIISASLEAAESQMDNPDFHTGLTTDEEDTLPPSAKRRKQIPARLNGFCLDEGMNDGRSKGYLPFPPKPTASAQLTVRQPLAVCLNVLYID